MSHNSLCSQSLQTQESAPQAASPLPSLRSASSPTLSSTRSRWLWTSSSVAVTSNRSYLGSAFVLLLEGYRRPNPRDVHVGSPSDASRSFRSSWSGCRYGMQPRVSRKTQASTRPIKISFASEKKRCLQWAKAKAFSVYLFSVLPCSSVVLAGALRPEFSLPHMGLAAGPDRRRM